MSNKLYRICSEKEILLLLTKGELTPLFAKFISFSDKDDKDNQDYYADNEMFKNDYLIIVNQDELKSQGAFKVEYTLTFMKKNPEVYNHFNGGVLSDDTDEYATELISGYESEYEWLIKKISLKSGLLIDIKNIKKGVISKKVMDALLNLKKNGIPKTVVVKEEKPKYLILPSAEVKDKEEFTDINNRIEFMRKRITEYKMRSKPTIGKPSLGPKIALDNRKSFRKSDPFVDERLKQIDAFWKQKESIIYNHKGIKKILQSFDLKTSSKSSTAIRGYVHYGTGYELDRTIANLIYFHGVGKTLLNNIVETLKANKFDVQEVRTNTITVKPFYNWE